MRVLFLCIVLLCFTRSHGQEWNAASGNNILAFEAGYTNFRPFALNNHLSAAGATLTLSAFSTVGIGNTNSLAVSRGGFVDGSLAFHYFIPVQINGDSLRYKFSGWELMTSTYGFELLRKAKWIDFVIAPGVFWGNIKMRKFFSGGNPKQFEIFKNPFIAPMIRTDLRFNFGPVSVGGRWSYRYDISNSRWKKGSSETLPGYKAREMQYIVYIGWLFDQGGAGRIN